MLRKFQIKRPFFRPPKIDPNREPEIQGLTLNFGDTFGISLKILAKLLVKLARDRKHDLYFPQMVVIVREIPENFKEI